MTSLLTRFFCFLSICLCLVGSSEEEAHCFPWSCHAVDPNRLNVHLVPHSHDDVGWLKTVDQYFYGKNISYQRAGVQYIIDSVVHALEENPDRRFIQVETAYFWRWWTHQDEETQETVRRLVDSGRLEFAGGGWSMNDEAAVNYQSTIDQFTLGLGILNETFGFCGVPLSAWQIDPFGHTAEMASLLYDLGFWSLFFPRLDYRDVRERQKSLNTEFFWKSSPSDDRRLFTSLIYRFYDAPATFCWDVLCGDEPMIEDEESPAYNMERRVDQFYDYIQKQKQYYKTPNILITMGGDFTYQAASMYYKNLDKLIKGFKKFKGDEINMIYSTPSCYSQAVSDYAYAHNVSFSTKTDDFVPYVSDEHSYWTGYYTSRPNSKRLERMGNNLLQVMKQLISFEKAKGKDFTYDIKELKEVMGIMQHHDAITGTEKQHVANDYLRLLTKGLQWGGRSASEMFYDLLQKDDGTSSEKELAKVYVSSCLLSNITYCPASNSKRFSAVIYNPLSRTVSHYARLPVNSTKFKITDPAGQLVNYQIVPSIANFDYTNIYECCVLYDLVFHAKDLPPLGFKYYYVERLDDDSGQPVRETHGKYKFGNSNTGFQIDPSTGLLSSVTSDGATLPVKQQFLFYRGANGTNKSPGDRASGAYIFRPAESFPNAEAFSDRASIKVYTGDLVDEVHQTVNDWVKQIIRVYKEENYIEFDWLVGPIEYRDKLGVEVITRYTTDLKTEETFYTDSNGRGLVQRVRNYRPTFTYTNEEPVSGNYYPVTSRIVLKEKERNLEVGVFNDRAQGGSSLRDGEIELMIHRRLMNDDNFGAGEVLSEIEFEQGVVVRGQHQLLIGTGKGSKSVAAQQHDLAQRKLNAPWIFAGDASETGQSREDISKYFNLEFAGLTRDLPENIQMITLEPRNDNTLLLRLEHLFEKNEDPELSKRVVVNLEDILTLYKIKGLSQTLLGGNMWLEEIKEKDWPLKRASLEKKNDARYDPKHIPVEPHNFRTFVVDVEKK